MKDKQKEYILCASVHYDNGLEYKFQKKKLWNKNWFCYMRLQTPINM